MIIDEGKLAHQEDIEKVLNGAVVLADNGSSREGTPARLSRLVIKADIPTAEFPSPEQGFDPQAAMSKGAAVRDAVRYSGQCFAVARRNTGCPEYPRPDPDLQCRDAILPRGTQNS